MVLNFTLWIRLFLTGGLVFYFLIIACTSSRDTPANISLQWKNDKATGIIIPRHLLNHVSEDSLDKLLHIHLIDTQSAMLGEWTKTEEQILFEPLIPLTRGLSYEVRLRGKSLGQISAPLADASDAPAIISVYPTKDTLPHNLLKMYIRFSKPMQEGKAMEHIVLIKDKQDTVDKVFLNLQPELWNKDRTMLTLWLDPGRIKRDLQPNKMMGEPLQLASNYQLVIGKDWRDIDGLSLKQAYHKNFIVVQRDSLSPNPDLWKMQVPTAGTKQSLRVEFGEPLDYALLTNAIRIVNKEGKPVPGVVKVSKGETMLSFAPSATWNPGMYILESESRLEDLAGNNLNRPFDRDITDIHSGEAKEVSQRTFYIRKE